MNKNRPTPKQSPEPRAHGRQGKLVQPSEAAHEMIDDSLKRLSKGEEFLDVPLSRGAKKRFPAE